VCYAPAAGIHKLANDVLTDFSESAGDKNFH
jgi:hypothetical protein